MNLRDNESLLNWCDPLIYLIYNRSRAGKFDALRQCFLVLLVTLKEFVDEYSNHLYAREVTRINSSLKAPQMKFD